MEKIREIIHIPPSCRERFLRLRHDDSSPLYRNGVALGGISSLVGPYQIGRPLARFDLLLYTITGAGRMQTQEKSHTLSEGTLFMAPRGAAYGYRVEKEPWEICWIHVEKHRPGNLAEGLGFTICQGAFTDAVVQLMQLHLAETARPGTYDSLTVVHLEELLLSYLRREVQGSAHAVSGPADRLMQLRNLVDAQLHYPWNLKELASRINVSGVYLIQLMKRYWGTTPLRMVNTLRMERTGLLLRSTDYPLKTIAEMVGFSSPYALSTSFKRYQGVAPRQYRERKGEGDGASL